MTADNLNEFQRGYVECALWTYDGNDGENDIAIEDFDSATIEQMIKDCKQFYQDNARNLIRLFENQSVPYSRSQAGHDFWLTRNRHGSGFWDRGLGVTGEHLTRKAEILKEVSLYIGEGGLIYAE